MVTWGTHIFETPHQLTTKKLDHNACPVNDSDAKAAKVPKPDPKEHVLGHTFYSEVMVIWYL